VLGRHADDLVEEVLGLGQPHRLHGALDHEGVAEVVDVLAGAAEVDELRQARGLGVVALEDLRQAALEVVLDGLDVVHGLALDLGELGDVVGTEIGHDGTQLGDLGLAQLPHPGHDLTVGEVDEPLDLDVHARPVEGRLTEVVDERRHSLAVAAVEGAESDRRGDVRERGHARHSVTDDRQPLP